MFASLKKLFGEAPEAPADRDVITILHGGKSGNAEFVASEAARYLGEQKLKVRVKNMSGYKAETLLAESRVVFIVSTHGEGDPPPAAIRFFKQLRQLSGRLETLRFAVCALGDSEYEQFCQAGKDLEQRLVQLGAREVLPRTDCDAAFEKAATAWILSVAKWLTGDQRSPSLNLEGSHKREWHTAVVREKRQLNPGSGEAVYHLCLAIDGQRVRYLPGDAVGVVPRNPDELVDRILSATRLDPGAPVGEPQMPLREFLQTNAELTGISRAVLKRHLDRSADENLADLLNDDEATRNYLQQHDLLDVLTDFPARLRPADLAALPDQPKIRYYSVSSCQAAAPDELHLTVKQVEFEYRQRRRKGAASNYLSTWLEVGTSVSFFLSPDDEFRLPVSAVPAIFIGVGTGIAPIRAFLAERAMHAGSRNWLFFGEKNRSVDYLYGGETERLKQAGQLERLSLAFSRDQQEKIYVQDLLVHEAAEFRNWIDAGAHVYVCGSLKMGQAVRQAVDSIAEAGDRAGLVAELQAQNRWHEELY